MTTLAVYLVVLVVVGAVLFGIAALVFGRGEELAPLPSGATPTVLPEVDVRGEDVRGLRFQQVVRGYKASEVDWALEHLAAEVDRLHDLLTAPPPEQIPAPPAERIPAPPAPPPNPSHLPPPNPSHLPPPNPEDTP